VEIFNEGSIKIISLSNIHPIITYFHSSQCRLILYLHQRPIFFKANSIQSSIVAILELIRGAQCLIEEIRSSGEEMWRVDAHQISANCGWFRFSPSILYYGNWYASTRQISSPEDRITSIKHCAPRISSKMATIDEFALKNIGLWWRYGISQHCDEWKYIIIGRIFESEIILIPPSLKIFESSSNGSYRNMDEVWWRYGISRSCDECKCRITAEVLRKRSGLTRGLPNDEILNGFHFSRDLELMCKQLDFVFYILVLVLDFISTIYHF
jgi:hypothetical protein